MKIIITLLGICLLQGNLFAQQIDSAQLFIDEVNKKLEFQSGVIDIPEANAQIVVPDGFGFLDKEKSKFLLSEIWGNPETTTVLGMLVPKETSVLDQNGWAFTIQYDPIGFVDDDDAEDINYDELLTEMKNDFATENPKRTAAGYPAITLVGWASAPFYDKTQKTLHWAKEISFQGQPVNTLNYNLRVLGRKGVLVINAVAAIKQLPVVKANLSKIMSNVKFTPGNTYQDFDSKVDNVAAWSLGGLVAGKVLAKVGFFALLAKFWKIIAIGVVAAASAVWKFISNRRANTPPAPPAEAPVEKIN